MVTEKKKAIYMCLLLLYVCIADHIEKGKSRFGSIHCDWLQVFMLKLEMVYHGRRRCLCEVVRAEEEDVVVVFDGEIVSLVRVLHRQNATVPCATSSL